MNVTYFSFLSVSALCDGAHVAGSSDHRIRLRKGEPLPGEDLVLRSSLNACYMVDSFSPLSQKQYFEWQFSILDVYGVNTLLPSSELQ